MAAFGKPGPAAFAGAATIRAPNIKTTAERVVMLTMGFSFTRTKPQDFDIKEREPLRSLTQHKFGHGL
jgi:hypothetical protein